MKLDFDSHRIEIPCGGCGKKHADTIGGFKVKKKFTCSCGAVNSVDTTKFEQGAREAQKALDDFQATMRKLGKR